MYPTQSKGAIEWGTRHRNPVKRGLVEKPEDWRSSSFCAYAYDDLGLVRVNCQEWPQEIKYTHSFENRE